MMIYDRQITISAAGSRMARFWPPQTLAWSELIARISTPIRGTETLTEYLKYPRGRQDDLKDVGGFVAGSLGGNRRKAAAVTGRDVLTLDMDNIQPGGMDDVLLRVAGLGCGYAIYSTRKHHRNAPRLRVLIPLNRTATADEYEPLARRLAQWIGLDLCDPTTFEASRLMFWPSASADSQFVATYEDLPFLDADGVLATYTNWHNIAEWPEVPGAAQAPTRMAAKQGDPTGKSGVVGAFCRIYDIHRAIAELLPSEYAPSDLGPNRYTFTGGSTSGGAVVYDDGKFLYSHHATDPCSGQLVNAFDLVRLHKFNARDDDVKPGTPINRMPSYVAMCEYAIADTQVAAVLNQERYESVAADFKAQGAEAEAADWIKLLAVSHTTGAPAKTIKNVLICLRNDPRLAGHIKMDTFAEALMGVAPLPWAPRSTEEGPFRWTDSDDSGLRNYIEQILGYRIKDLIQDALILYAAENAYNPVRAYLEALAWDEVPRLDTLYVDYMGADDTSYTRAVTRKGVTAAVARAMQPGIKFDTMTVLCGRQGIGKSTLFARMGGEWFSDSLKTFAGKEAAELLQGVWIVEVGELEAYGKSDVREVKSFLSKCDDQYRAAYARKTEKHLRRCVFFGTTNDHDYLKDTTGNRRFWPVDAEFQKPSKNIFQDLTADVATQIWAEAAVRWRAGESLCLDADLEVEAEIRRAQHLDMDPLAGQIAEFLDQPVPEDWQTWSLDRRRMYWAGGVNTKDLKTEPRDRICAIEIWRECLCENRTSAPKQEAHRINALLEAMTGWERVSTLRFGAGYGTQKGFRRMQAYRLAFITGPKNGKNVNHAKSQNVNQVNHENDDGLHYGLHQNALDQHH